jgi:hypothetical protein
VKAAKLEEEYILNLQR